MRLFKWKSAEKSDEINNFMVDQACRIVKGTALAYDVQYEIEKVGEGGELRNDDELASLVAEVAKSVPSCHKVVERKEDWVLRRLHPFLPLEYALEAEKLSSLLSVQTELQPITRENLIFDEKGMENRIRYL